MKKWKELPANMQNEAVRNYYDILKKKTMSLFWKRFFDIVMSIVFLGILSPVILILAILIKADTPGPVFYRQERVTRYGKVFKIHKFRSMVNNADKKGTLVTTSGDARITKIGKKIRDKRIDEIPQLIDVLQGNMSFVGTRPEAVKYVEKYTDEMMATLLLPAGITSKTSIEYKDEAKLLDEADDVDKVYIEKILPEKMKYNLEGLASFSLINEIKVLFATIKVIFG